MDSNSDTECVWRGKGVVSHSVSLSLSLSALATLLSWQYIIVDGPQRAFLSLVNYPFVPSSFHLCGSLPLN